MNKFIVITSIFPPTTAVKRFAKYKDWNLIVVGDKKTPHNWSSSNVTYLSTDFQKKQWPKLGTMIPWNNYGRKTIGYLYAIDHQADYIADTDDDNIPKRTWGNQFPFEGTFKTIAAQNGYFNVYSYFTKEHVWPRGYPLQYIASTHGINKSNKKHTIGVWQYLADEDPDVDAIYRLTVNKPIYFDKKNPIVLATNTVCPYNSQNTITRKETFPLLYMPSFVTIRFTDILRGLVAQPIMWKHDYTLGFAHATVIQKRNPHNYLKDFEHEIPNYLYAERVISIVSGALVKGHKNTSIAQDLYRAYEALVTEKIVPKEELLLVKEWVSYF